MSEPYHPFPTQGPPSPEPHRTGAPGAPDGPDGTGPLAVVSVVTGAIPLLFGLVQLALQVAVLQSDRYEVVGVVVAVQAVLALLLGATAIVTGAIVLGRRGLRRGLAGVGVGLGIAAVWGAILAGLYPLTFGLLLGS